MHFIDIPTEQTTAVTDAISMAIAIAAALYLHWTQQKDRWKTNLWIVAFSMLSLAAMLGAIAHGFQMSKAFQAYLWHPLNLSLGLLVALFVVAVVYDIWGKIAARRVLPMMALIGCGFFGVTLIWPDSFLVFIIYEATVMFFALAGYTWLAIRGSLEGAWFMAAGVLITIIAAGIQASNTVSFALIWPFDHNGVYHLVQMLGIVAFVLGLRRSVGVQS